MNFTVSLMGVEFLSVSLSFPRLGIFALDSLPDSVEAVESWVQDMEGDEE